MNYHPEAGFPNYYLQDADRHTGDVNLFGESQRLEEPPLFHLPFAPTKRNANVVNNEEYSPEELLGDLRSLFFVHYVSNHTTLQGLSLRYDCPLIHIKQVNKIFSISHTGHIGIRKLVLVPLVYCGERVKKLKYYKLSNPDARLQISMQRTETETNTGTETGSEAETADALEDVEGFYQESFGAQSYCGAKLYEMMSDPKVIRTLPASVVSRLIWRDIGQEFKHIPELQEHIEHNCNNLIHGFGCVEADKAPTLLVKVPEVFLSNVGVFKRSKSSLPTPKSSVDSEFAFPEACCPQSCSEGLEAPFFERVLDDLWNSISRRKEDIPPNIELDDLQKLQQTAGNTESGN